MRAAAVAAVVLVAAAWVARRRADVDQAAPVVVYETGNGWAELLPPVQDAEPFDMLAGFDQVQAQVQETAAELAAPVLAVWHLVRGTDASTMTTSPAGIAHLQQFEGLRLTRYRLGDGGYTIGWGRFYPDSGPPPPETITRAQADAWFLEDVAERGERWVRAYVTAPLTQPQFDALVSMAYNLSPRSFRSIADAVNAGEDPEAAALRYVRAGTGLERGLRRRRAAELALFRTDPTTYAG